MFERKCNNSIEKQLKIISEGKNGPNNKFSSRLISRDSVFAKIREDASKED